MSRDEKLVQRLLSRPKDFTYNELCRVLKYLYFKECQGGKTTGSRVAFIEHKTKHIIRLHEPHPDNEMKQYQIEQVIEELHSRGLV